MTMKLTNAFINLIFNLNLSKMKHTFMKKGLFALLLIAGTTALAQTTTGADNVAQGDAAGVSVKLIDNKGTIKYLQANNGITTITSTEADNLTTTTWQLGGSLLEDTYIDVDGNVFAFDGIELVDPAALAASTDATDQSDHGTGTGWTILVRDEATGAVKKLKATDLMQGGHATHTLGADATADFDITATGVSTEFDQVWVYRNGAKLVANTDYTVAADKVTIVVAGLPQGYKDDFFEVQWVK